MLDNIDTEYFLRVHEEIGTISASDISVSCPLCQEGKSWGRKHRLHLYIKPSYDTASVHCWNCSYTSNIFGYLKEFHPQEFSSYRKAKANSGFEELKMDYSKPVEKTEETNISSIKTGLDFNQPEPQKTQDDLAEGESELSTSDMEVLSNMDFGFSMDSTKPKKVQQKPKDPNLPLLINPSGVIKNLNEPPQEVINYLNKRGLEPQEDWLYSPRNNKITFNKTLITLSEFIIIPLKIKDEWYGFQALGWKQKRFFIYLVTGNTSWKVWNWDSINKEEPVYIFESVYDALSSGLDNVVSALGANLHEDRLKQLKNPVFCLDNQHIDEKSKEESLKYLEEGYEVFIWPDKTEKFKDTNDLRKVNAPKEKIKRMINNNIYKGMTGVLKLKFI